MQRISKFYQLPLLFVYYGLTFYHVKGQNLFFEKVTGQSITIDTDILGIAKDSLGFIWFGTWNGLFRYNGSDIEAFKHRPNDSTSLPGNKLRNIITDDNRQLWILTFENKYVKYNYALNQFITVYDSLVTPNVKILLKSNPNQLNRYSEINGIRYFIYSNYFASYDKKTNDTLIYYPDIYRPGSLTEDCITSFYIDDQKIIWIGSRNGNIFKANTSRNPFDLHHVYFSNKYSPTLAAIRTILKSENQLWLGSNDNGLFVFNNEAVPENMPRYFRPDYKEKRIRSLLEDFNRNIWIGGVDGLACYNTCTEKFHRIVGDEKTELPIVKVYTMSLSKKKIIWAGIYNGLARIDPNTYQVIIYNLSNLIRNKIVMKIIEDQFENIWLATEGNGIIRLSFDSLGNCTDTLLIDDFSNKTDRIYDGKLVYSLHEDLKGNIWAGTSEGLNCINPESFEIRQFTKKDGLQDDYITAITSDKKGNIWVTHKKGISKIEKNNFNVSNFTISGNNSNWVFMDGSYFNDSMNKRIYFGAREGYVSFDPERIKTNTASPDLLLTSFYLSGKQVSPNSFLKEKKILSKSLYLTDQVTLGYDSRNFSIEMTALNYQNPGGIIYSYILEGYDEKWIQSPYNAVTYDKVRSGKYIFRAKAVSSEGNWSKEVQLNIHILPPWYTTWQAIIIYVVIISSLSYLSYKMVHSRKYLKEQLLIEKLNVEKQEEITREKLEFFANVSHELRTPLTLITTPLKQLQKENITKDKKSLYFSIINRNVDHLFRLINQLLDFRKAEAKKLDLKFSLPYKKVILNNKPSKRKNDCYDKKEVLTVHESGENKKPTLLVVEDNEDVQTILRKELIDNLENEKNFVDNRFLRRTIEIINNNLDVLGFNPEQLANLLGISQRQLYRKLKAISGSTVQEFITRVKMERASEMLINSKLNISEIAYRVGYTEPSNFSRTFSKHYGCSPSKYAQSHN